MSQRGAEQRFYKGNQLQLIVSQLQTRRVFGWEGQVFAEHHNSSGQTESIQIATYMQRSPLSASGAGSAQPMVYSCYGFNGNDNDYITGFTGQYQDRASGCYILGNGYRTYNPTLMRFHSPDSASPFDEGGINAYAYCAGDPINHFDPTGHGLRSILGSIIKTPAPYKKLSLEKLSLKELSPKDKINQEFKNIKQFQKSGNKQKLRELARAATSDINELTPQTWLDDESIKINRLARAARLKPQKQLSDLGDQDYYDELFTIEEWNKHTNTRYQHKIKKLVDKLKNDNLLPSTEQTSVTTQVKSLRDRT